MWVARDKDGTLHLFCRGVNPKRANETAILRGKWFDGIDLPIEIDKTLFPELTWNDEPIEVELVSKYTEPIDEEKLFGMIDMVYESEYSTGEYCHKQSFSWGFQEGYIKAKED